MTDHEREAQQAEALRIAREFVCPDRDQTTTQRGTERKVC
jgi:hypothetical protein